MRSAGRSLRPLHDHAPTSVIPRLFWLVAAVVLVDMMFFAAVAPLLPHYEEELGLSKAGAGILTAAYPAGVLFGALPGGLLIARVGVKPTLLTGLAMLGTTSFAFGFADTVVMLNAARFTQGIGGAFMWAAGMAWLVGAAPRDRRGELIGAALGVAILGMLLGPVLGALATVAGTEPVFAGVSVLAATLATWAWRTPGVKPPRGLGATRPLEALRRRPVLVGFWLFSLPALFAGVLAVLVPLRLGELGASGVGIGAAFLIAGGVEATLSWLSGRLSDRIGRFRIIRLGLIGAVAMAIVMPLPPTTVLVAGGLVVAVAALATFWAPAMALLSEASEAAGLDQGYAFALSNAAWSLGYLWGGGGGGALAEATADAVPYALLALTCAATLAAVPRRRRVSAAGGAVAGRCPGS